jgi:DNA transformation protein
MFGGAGLYCDGVLFVLILGDTLYVKMDAENGATTRPKGSSPLRYRALAKTVEIGACRRAPERLLDDVD